MDKCNVTNDIPVDSGAIRGKYPVYPTGNYFGIIYKVIPKWQISKKGKRFCRYWVIVLLFKNLTTEAEFEKPVQFWFFPGPILKSGLGRGWNIDLNEMAYGLGIHRKSVYGKNRLPLSGVPVVVAVRTIEIDRNIMLSAKPVFGNKDRMVDEENTTMKIIRNKVEFIWNANDHLGELPIPDDFDLEVYHQEQKKLQNERKKIQEEQSAIFLQVDDLSFD